jgi:hypothetical protein
MNHDTNTPWWKSGHKLMMAGCVVIAGYVFLFTDTSWQTAVFFLICPLMHIFMMKGMDHDCHQNKDKSPHISTEPHVSEQPLKHGKLVKKEF